MLAWSMEAPAMRDETLRLALRSTGVAPDIASQRIARPSSGRGEQARRLADCLRAHRHVVAAITSLLAAALVTTSSACVGDVLVGADLSSYRAERIIPRDGGPAGARRTGTVDLAQEGATALDGVAIIDGDLVVGGLAEAALTLFSLNTVTGDVVIRANNLLQTLTLGGLLDIGGDLVIEDNPALTSATLPALEALGGRLRTARNDALTLLDVNALVQLGGDLDLTVETLARFAPPRLNSIDGDLVIEGPTEGGPIALSFPALESVDGRLIITDHQRLLSVNLPVLSAVGSTLTIRDNVQLQALTMPALTRAGALVCVCQNPALPSCVADALAAQLAAAGHQGSIDTSDNLADGSCS